MAFLVAPATTGALVVVWYEANLEPVVSAENREKIAQDDWNALVGNGIGAVQDDLRKGDLTG
jgi:hypothetical protein